MNGTEFKQLRSQLGHTQRQLGEELETNAAAVSRWERGKTAIPNSIAETMREFGRFTRGAESERVGTGVILDELHEEILIGLNRTLDPEVFEQCAAALIGRELPGLTPVRGGGDDGFDGAFP